MARAPTHKGRGVGTEVDDNVADHGLPYHTHSQGAAYAYERALLPVYTQSNKILLDLGEKHPELKKIPFYPQKKGVGTYGIDATGGMCPIIRVPHTATKLSDLKDASQ